MRGNLQTSHGLDETLGVVVLVGGRRDATFPGSNLGDHGLGGIPFRRTVGLSNFTDHDQTVAVLGQHMGRERQASLVSATLAEELCFRVGNRCMGFVDQLLATEITGRVLAGRRRRVIVLGLEALDGGPGLDQGAVNAEVILGEQLLALGLLKDFRQEPGGNVGLDHCSWLVLKLESSQTGSSRPRPMNQRNRILKWICSTSLTLLGIEYNT